MSTLPSLSDFDFVTVVGPTACGKTSFAVALADHIGAEIISADSRQVYRRMDLGTGKDLGEYCVEGRPVAHHLIDIVEPGTKYNLYRYQHDFLEAFEDIRRRGKRTVVCGGTGVVCGECGTQLQHQSRSAESGAPLLTRGADVGGTHG